MGRYQHIGRRFTLKCLVLTGLLCVPFTLSALDPSMPLNKHIHRVWQAAEGLPQNSIQALVQTEDGYIWLGTQEGLVRFDGARFQVFDKINSSVFRNHDITALLADGPRLWIGNRAGNVYYFQDGGFHATSDTGNAVITCFARDLKGRVLAGTFGSGIYQFENGRFSAFEHQGRLEAAGINALLNDGESLWIGASENGLIRLQGDVMTRYSVDDGLSGDRIYALTKDHKGRLWIGEESGLNRFDGKTIKVYGRQDGLVDPYVISIYEDGHQNLWLGTYSRGIALMRDQEFQFFDTTIGAVSNDNITRFLEDYEGNLWVGTGNGGLNQYAESRFFTISTRDGLSDGIVWTVYDDPMGGLWIVTNDGGIFEYKDGVVTDFRERFSIGEPYVAYNLMRDQSGAFWVGTDVHGLLRETKDGMDHFKAETHGFGDDGILCMAQDGRGDIWIGTFGGLARFRNERFSLLTTDDGLPDEIISAIMIDSDDVLWVGTEKGIARKTQDGFQVYTTADGLLSDRSPYLYQDSLGAVWSVAEGLGVSRIHNGKIHGFRADDGLFSENLFLMREDPRGALWFSSNLGLFRIPTKDFPRYIRGDIDQLEFQAFGQADGMVSVECTFGGMMSVSEAENGDLWFPTVGGVVRIDPDNVEVDRRPSRVLVEELRFDGGRRLNDDARPIAAGSANFEFHYTSLSFHASQRVRFNYMLEGYDQDWIDAGDRRAAYYSNLPPGDYRFKVKGTNSAGIWNEKLGEMTFRLEAFYYQTAVFRAGVVFGILLLGWLLHSINIKSHERHRRELERQVEVRKSELDNTKRELIQLNSQLAENARIEGMAEIAADVLHNIGNELNTAGTSALMMNQVFEQAETTRLLERIADLVVENADELGDFIQNNPRGQRLPAALEGIEEILDTSRSDFLGELAVFKSHVLKIKKIVEVQQDMRKHLRELEPTDLNIILEDVLQMHTNMLRTYEIETIQDYRPLPLVTAFRSDLFQALNNIVQNACEALRDAPPQNPRKLIIRTANLDQDRIQIEIQDTGAGIETQELPLIFENGYTTKSERSGFGLHYCLSVIEELDGTLNATSSGPNHGSKFTLVLPLGHEKHEHSGAGSSSAVG